MGQLYNEDWEHVDVEAFREAIIKNGVITGLEVTQSATPAMSIQVSAGQCTVDAVVYSEAADQNLNISNGDATNDRKDIIVYDTTGDNPLVVEGTPAAAPIPPDIPSGDILLGIVLVEANESTSILNADITNDRVFAIDRWALTAVSANTTLNDAHKVVTVDATGGIRTITLPTAVGVMGKVYVIKKIDSSANAVTVAANGVETIDGYNSFYLEIQWDSIIIQSDGANWIKLIYSPTSRTRQIFLHTPIQYTGSIGAGDYGIMLNDSADQYAKYMFMIPEDFTSITGVYIYYKGSNTSGGNILLTIQAFYRGLSEPMNAHYDGDTYNVIAVTDINEHRFTTSGILVSASVDDTGYIIVKREGTEIGDTTTGSTTILGVLIEYKSDT